VLIATRYSFDSITARSWDSSSDQRTLNCIPNNIQVYVEVTVNHAIVHPAHLRPRNLGMCHRKLFALVNSAGSSLSDCHHIEYNGLLSTPVCQKLVFRYAPHILARQLRRFQHVGEAVVEACLRLIVAHTGSASRRTFSRER
jgi:hypothetical protein